MSDYLPEQPMAFKGSDLATPPHSNPEGPAPTGAHTDAPGLDASTIGLKPSATSDVQLRTFADKLAADPLYWAKVQVTLGCWLWTGGRNSKKYGNFGRSENGRMRVRYAHRYAWSLVNGPIPDGLCVLHACDVRHCVRPDHLFVGTQADNTHDMVRKGRTGQAKAQVRLTWNAVRVIRQRYAAGERQASIARDLGILPRRVGRIVRREKWIHDPVEVAS